MSSLRLRDGRSANAAPSTPKSSRASHAPEYFFPQQQRNRLRFLIALLLTCLVYELYLHCVYYSSIRNYTITRRRLLPRDDFFHKSIPDELADEYFSFDASGVVAPPVVPMWSCNRTFTDLPTRLVFLHFSRSGGSAIRALLKGYSQYCHYSIAIIQHCQHLAHSYLPLDKKHDDPDNVWRNEVYSAFSYQPCQLLHASGRYDNDKIIQDPIVPYGMLQTNLLQDNDIDIVAGQVPFGINEYWLDSNNTTMPVQYIVMFRDPLTKFISEYLQATRRSKVTDASVVQSIYKLALYELSRGKWYDDTTDALSPMHQLITPKQKWWISRNKVNATLDRRVNLTMSNLAKENVVVGILEHFDDSLSLLQTLIDKEHKLTQLFDFFRQEQQQHDEQTTRVAELILTNSTVNSAVQEYLQYEYKVYNYAVSIHEAQVKMIANKQRNNAKVV